MSAGGGKRQSARDETQIAQTLIKSGLYVQRKLNQVCLKYGINVNQFIVLNEVILKGPLSQKVLCERLVFEKSNISKIVKSLLTNGLVRVVEAPEDRRVTLIIETHEGTVLWKSCLQGLSGASADIFSFLSDDEMMEVVDLLKDFIYEFRQREDV